MTSSHLRRSKKKASGIGATLPARETPTRASAEGQRLIAQIREANERLIVAAVHAQNLSDQAQAEAAEVRAELDDLMNRLRNTNERLATAAAAADTLAEAAGRREEEYRQLSIRLLTMQDEERRRLALELHESAGQCLAALTMNLDVVDGATRALDARSRRTLAEGRSLAEQCSRSVRTFAYLLYPPLLDERGLVSAVRWYVEG